MMKQKLLGLFKEEQMVLMKDKVWSDDQKRKNDDMINQISYIQEMSGVESIWLCNINLFFSFILYYRCFRQKW